MDKDIRIYLKLEKLMNSVTGFDKTIWSKNWRESWQDIRFRIQLFITAILLVVTVHLISDFFDFIESRPGVLISDPFLNLFQPKDVTWITFIVIYLSVLVVLVYLSWQPRQLVLAFQAYIILLLARMLSMYLLPLEAPAHLIPLEDPFIESISSAVLTKDLFFSGHTSTMFLLALVSKNKAMKIFFLTCTLLVAAFVLIQHVHYTVDVVAAPFYSYGCYRLGLFLHTSLEKM